MDNHRKIRKKKANPKDSTQIYFLFLSGEVLLSSVRFSKHGVKTSDFSGLLKKIEAPKCLTNKNREKKTLKIIQGEEQISSSMYEI